MTAVSPRFRPDPEARLRLFCLPHAGAGASQFYAWTRLLPRDIQVCPLHLPGRENRLAEPAHTRMSPLVRELAAAISPHVEAPYAVFGHSMGAAVAFELARELRRRGLRRPGHLFLSGFRAPHSPAALPPIAAEPDPLFLQRVQDRYGSFAKEVLNEPELLQLVLTVLRADLDLIENYRCEEEPPLDCALSVLGGTDDRTVTAAALHAWAVHTTGPFDLTWIPGGHSFVTDSRRQVLDALERRLVPGRPEGPLLHR